MRKKRPHAPAKSTATPRSKALDTLLEEYMSKLEKKVVSQTQQLKTITDNAASSLFMIDTDGRPTFMNPAAVHITGYSQDEIKGLVLHDVIHVAHPDSVPHKKNMCPILTALVNMQQIKDHEDTFVRKDGSVFPVSFSLTPFREDGELKGAVLEFQDITKRKELERQKDDFIGVASHELKTPVTSMKTYVQVLKRKLEKQGDAASAQSMSKIDMQINKLSALIADLLDATRTHAGNLNFRQEVFEVDALIKETVENMQLTTERHTISIKGSAHARIMADRDRTGQVLINFLSNAIKYSPKSKRIVVRVACKKGEIIVGVQDFGIGIPPDKIDQIFGRFVRVSGPHMETFAGLGLGLYISSQIIMRQGGRIWVKSKENKGSIFYFSLPLNSATIASEDK